MHFPSLERCFLGPNHHQRHNLCWRRSNSSKLNFNNEILPSTIHIPSVTPFVTIHVPLHGCSSEARDTDNPEPPINRADPENGSASGSEYNSSRKKITAKSRPPTSTGSRKNLANQVVQTIRLQVGNPKEKEYNDRMKRMKLRPMSQLRHTRVTEPRLLHKSQFRVEAPPAASRSRTTSPNNSDGGEELAEPTYRHRRTK